jgi:mono/diheme cytochrome c family protein
MPARAAIFLMFLFLFLGCRENSSKGATSFISKSNGEINARLIASQCYQCHGTHGISRTKWESIAGEDVEEVFESEHPLMEAQAKGYTKEELIAAMRYLSRFKAEEDEDERSGERSEDD